MQIDHERLSIPAVGPSSWLPPPSPTWIVQDGPVGVDGEKGVIRGYVAATAGNFASGRGRFDERSLEAALDLWREQPGGLSVHIEHGSTLPWFVGRAVRPRRSTAYRLDHRGRAHRVAAIRADLAIDASAAVSPVGDLRQYILTRAASDSGSLSSSLVLTVERRQEYEGAKYTPKRDAGGTALPLLWMPVALYGSDLVAMGDAVGDLLGRDGLVAYLRQKAAQRTEANRDHLQAIGHRLMHRRAMMRAQFGRPDSGLVNGGVDDSTIREIASELAKLPRAMLQQTWQTGATLEARRVNGSTTWRGCSTRDKVGIALGLAAAVFVDRLHVDDSASVTLHEFGHLFDNVAGVPSLTPEWLALWRADLAAGRIPDGNERTDAREWFGEAFACYFDSMTTRSRLSQPTRDYFQALAEKAEACIA